MTLLEILKNVGIEEETIAKIVEEMKTNKVYTAKEENLDVKYNKLKTDAESKSQELEKAKALIEELQKDSKGNEELQGKIKVYEDQIAELQRVNEAQAIDNALDRALIEAKVNDVDYVKFKLKEKYDAVENQLETFKDKAVIGEFNVNNENTLLEVGNGTIEAPSNAFEVYKDGTVKVSSGTLTIGNTTITEEQLQQLLALLQG